MVDFKVVALRIRGLGFVCTLRDTVVEVLSRWSCASVRINVNPTSGFVSRSVTRVLHVESDVVMW